MPSPVCDNPLGLTILKKCHKAGVQTCTDEYLQNCKIHLPQYPWPSGLRLCTRCRCSVAERIGEITARRSTAINLVEAVLQAIPVPVFPQPAPPTVPVVPQVPVAPLVPAVPQGPVVPQVPQIPDVPTVPVVPQPASPAAPGISQPQPTSAPVQVCPPPDPNASPQASVSSVLSNPLAAHNIDDPRQSFASSSNDSSLSSYDGHSSEERNDDQPTSNSAENTGPEDLTEPLLMTPNRKKRKRTDNSSSLSPDAFPRAGTSISARSALWASPISGLSIPSAAASSYMDKDVAAEQLNRTFQALEDSPLLARHSRNRNLFRKKLTKAKGRLSKLVDAFTGGKSLQKDDPCDCYHCNLMISTIKMMAPTLQTKKEKYTMLTCLPGFFSVHDNIKELQISKHMARKVTEYRRDNGPFFSPEFQSTAHPITDEVIEKVTKYYLSDENSKPSPTLTVQVKDAAGNKSLQAKRYMQVKARDAYHEFVKENEGVKIGPTKFLLLKPKQCRWPGIKGFPISCTCILHENQSLMLDALKNACFDNVNQNDDPDAAAVLTVLDNKVELINFVLCNTVTEDCCIGSCSKCPNEDQYDKLFKFVTDDEVEFDFWDAKPAMLNHLKLPADEFKDKFRTVLNNFMGHEYIYKQQKQYIAELKARVLLNPSYAVINVDFGENYSFVVQNAIQGFHWTNTQATIHPFVVYFARDGSDNVAYKTYFIISDELTHDATSFHCFRSQAITALLRDLPHITHVDYFSDGAGSQYKNYKNIMNLVHHVQDYNIRADWHFSATAHGKSTCDAMCAVVKRTCRLKSIRDGISILTAIEMFEVVRKELSSETLEFIFVSQTQVVHERTRLTDRYETARKIPGIRKLHCIEVLENQDVIGKVFSKSTAYEQFCVINPADVEVEQMPLYNIGEFIAVLIGKTYQVGKITSCNEGKEECTVIMMKKTGQGGVALQWPAVPRTHIIPCNDILGTVTAPSNTVGATFRLSDIDLNMVKAALIQRLERIHEY